MYSTVPFILVFNGKYDRISIIMEFVMIIFWQLERLSVWQFPKNLTLSSVILQHSERLSVWQFPNNLTLS